MVKSFKDINQYYKEKLLKKKIKTAFAIAILAFIIALIAFSSIQSPDIAFEIVVNNTDLGQNTEGGTGERVLNTIYYTNNTAIELLILAHSPNNTVGALGIKIYINGTLVSSTRQNNSLSNAQEYLSSAVIVPKNSNYNVSVVDFHHYEWREYPILSGKNGTLSINQTVIGGNLTVNFNSNDLYGSSRTQNVVYYNNLSNPIILDVRLVDKKPQSGSGSPTLNVNTITVQDFSIFTQSDSDEFAGYFYYLIPSGSNYEVNIGTEDTILSWYEYNLTGGGLTQVSGGGVSFNGSAVDLNGSLLYNGTFNGTYNGTINESQVNNLIQDLGNKTNNTPSTQFYVNNFTGNDSNPCYDISLPCKTIRGAYNKITIINNDTYINIFDGVYDGLSLNLGGKAKMGNYKIIFNGSTIQTDSGTITSFQTGSTTTQASMTDNTKNFPLYSMGGRYIKFSDGRIRLIENNTCTTCLNLSGTYFASAESGSYIIFENNVTISSDVDLIASNIEHDFININFQNFHASNSIVNFTQPHFNASDLNFMKFESSDIYLYKAWFNNTAENGGTWNVKSNIYMYGSVVRSNNKNTVTIGLIHQAGGQTLIRCGSVFTDLYFAAWSSGTTTILSDGGGCEDNLITSNFYKNNIFANYAEGGGHIIGSYKVFSGNTNDRTAEAISFSYIS